MPIHAMKIDIIENGFLMRIAGTKLASNTDKQPIHTWTEQAHTFTDHMGLVSKITSIMKAMCPPNFETAPEQCAPSALSYVFKSVNSTLGFLCKHLV